VVARAFADEHPVGIAAHQIHDVVGDQTVINHHVGLLDLLQPFERQQPGVAGAGANQHHFAAMIQRLRQQLLGGIRHGLPIVIGQRLRQPVVNKQLLPEASAFADGGKLLLHARAQMAGIAGQLAKMQGQTDSSFSRSRRASTGDVPPEETATISGERSMIDGIIKLACAGHPPRYRRYAALRPRR
jgi:hypothetical protein